MSLLEGKFLALDAILCTFDETALRAAELVPVEPYLNQ
jgi:hypothetical protein